MTQTVSSGNTFTLTNYGATWQTGYFILVNHHDYRIIDSITQPVATCLI